MKDRFAIRQDGTSKFAFGAVIPLRRRFGSFRIAREEGSFNVTLSSKAVDPRQLNKGIS
jgi:hypothetical protein